MIYFIYAYKKHFIVDFLNGNLRAIFEAVLTFFLENVYFSDLFLRPFYRVLLCKFSIAKLIFNELKNSKNVNKNKKLYFYFADDNCKKMGSQKCQKNVTNILFCDPFIANFQ